MMHGNTKIKLEILLFQFALFSKQGSLADGGYGDDKIAIFLLRRNLRLYPARNLFKCCNLNPVSPYFFKLYWGEFQDSLAGNSKVKNESY